MAGVKINDRCEKSGNVNTKKAPMPEHLLCAHRTCAVLRFRGTGLYQGNKPGWSALLLLVVFLYIEDWKPSYVIRPM